MATGLPGLVVTGTGVRGIARDVGVYGIGDASVRLIAFVSIPVLTRVMAPSQFGLMMVATTLVGLVASVAYLGGDSAYARFFFRAKGDVARRVVTTTWAGFLGLWSLLLTAILVTTSGPVAELVTGSRREADVFRLALATGPITVVNLILGQILRNNFRAVTFVTFNVLAAAIRVGFGITALVVFDLGVAGVVGAALAAELLVVPLRAWATKGDFGRVVSHRLLGEMLRFGVPLVPTSLAYWSLLVADRVLLSRLVDLRAVGIYGVATTIAGAMTIANGAMAQAWTPHAVRLFEEAPERARQRFGEALLLAVAGLGWLCVGLAAFAGWLVALVGGTGFEEATPAVAPLALGLVAFGTGQVTSLGMTLLLRTGRLTIVSLGATALNIGLCAVLIPVHGVMGAAWASLIAYVVQTSGYLACSQRLFAITVPSWRLLGTITLVCAVTWLVTAIPGDPVGLGAKVAVCAAFPVGLLRMRLVDPAVIHSIRGSIRGA